MHYKQLPLLLHQLHRPIHNRSVYSAKRSPLVIVADCSRLDYLMNCSMEFDYSMERELAVMLTFYLMFVVLAVVVCVFYFYITFFLFIFVL